MTDDTDLWERRTLPCGLALEMQADDDLALVLAQGENRVTMELAQVKTLVAALTDAAAVLAEVPASGGVFHARAGDCPADRRVHGKHDRLPLLDRTTASRPPI